MAGTRRTVDVYLIYTDEIKRTWLHVIDLKYGKGVTVSAETNRQVQAYCNLLREKHPNVRHFRGRSYNLVLAMANRKRSR